MEEGKLGGGRGGGKDDFVPPENLLPTFHDLLRVFRICIVIGERMAIKNADFHVFISSDFLSLKNIRWWCRFNGNNI